MKWSPKHDRYVVKKNKSMMDQRNLLQKEDRTLLWVTIAMSIFYIGLGLVYLILSETYSILVLLYIQLLDLEKCSPLDPLVNLS